ncbi:hypothetical protein K2173_016897 [Erythroxylum novogranatense]|uniref:Peroxidase n=1 Tax=Erythroxylum novogranatense TaxID=1862640 RepID=A0AAV8U6C7_9ROSI|nr:hypothetical protein K2173_016897 [Erythroxylum novogranatense]
MDITKLVLLLFVLFLLLKSFSSSTYGDDDGLLALDYYKRTCPVAEEIVMYNVEFAVLKNPRMAASLLRLHFHDCFVMGCDASVLLDSYGGVRSEKEAEPNLNSLHGFEVIDKIKFALEEACPLTISCADILAIAARDAVALRGGPRWEVKLGRKDSLQASFDGANKFIPSPNSSLDTLILNFRDQGLGIQDLVALSGSHTMGKARCSSIKQRIDDLNIYEKYDKYKRYTTFRKILRSICDESSRKNDKITVPLDFTTPARFDNHYYLNLLEGRGLLRSDNVLIAENYEEIANQVWDFASDQDVFFASFVKSMIKMGNINVLTGNDGEIRKNCRFVNL